MRLSAEALQNAESELKRDLPGALGVTRGIAIAAVMYGHALAPWVINAGDNFSQAAFLQWKAGASCLMLLFFFLSGLAWREHASLKMTLRQTLVLIFIAWAGSVLLEVVRLVLSWTHVAAMLGQPSTDLWSFVKSTARVALLGEHYTMATMWFLTALGIVRLIAAVAMRGGFVVVTLVGVALLALGAVSTALEWRNVYQVAVLGVGYVSFFAGRGARPWFDKIEAKPLLAAALMVASGVGLFGTFALNQGCPLDYAARCGQPYLNGEFSISLSYGVFGYLPMFVFTAAAGIVFLLMWAIVMAHYTGVVARRLSVWGRNTVALLVVNGALLEWLHPLMVMWVAPRAPTDQIWFYAVLLAFTLLINFAMAAVLHRPLRMLFATAMKLATFAVDLPRHAELAVSASRRPRVSEAGE